MTSTATENLVCQKTGKECFDKAQAQAKAAWWRKARFARMNAYACRHCRKWHIGNNRNKPARRAW